MNPEKTFLWFCNNLGSKLKGKASDELRTSVEFLGWDTEPECVVGAGKVALMLAFAVIIAGLLIGLMAGLDITLAIIGIPISIAMFFLLTEWPKTLAKQKAMRALGYAPIVIAQLAVPLKQNPNLESAVTFMSEHAEGEIAKDFKAMLRDAWNGKLGSLNEGIKGIAAKWGKFSSGFNRSMQLIIASFHEKDNNRRQETLDKSLDVVLDDTLTKMTEYANGLHIPTLMLFSLGIIVPLMIVSLFPMVAFFGVSVTPGMVAAFLFLSVLATYLYSNSILRNRPPTFSEYEVESEIPEGYMKAGAVVPAAQFSLAVALMIALPGIFYFASSAGAALSGPLKMLSGVGAMSMIWAAGIGIAVYSWGTSSHKKKARADVKAMEDQFMDAIYHVRNRLLDGRPIEDALEFSEKMSSGSQMAQLLKRVLNKVRRKSMPLEKAFAEEKIGSVLVKSSINLLISSLKKGSKTAAQTASVVVEYTSKIKKVERDLVGMLQKNLSMMRATAIFFAPIVCAIIIVLFQMITSTISATSQKFGTIGYSSFGSTMLSQPAISPETLMLIVGFYAIMLNFVLTRYISRIQWGPDDVNLKLELSKSMPLMLIVFTATLIISQTVLLNKGLI